MKKLLFLTLALLVTALSFAPTNCPTTSAAAPVAPSAPVPPVGGLCDMGNNPAATLLVPYFEVDSANNLGLDTLCGIVNVAGHYVVAHVVVWNVDSWAVFDFNIVLTPYDLVTFSMRDILVNGNLPNNCCVSSSSRFRTVYVDCNGDGQYFGQAWTLNDGLFSAGGYNMDIACYGPLSGLSNIQCKLSVGSYDGWNANYVGYLTIDNTLTCNGGMPDYNPLRYFSINYIDTNNDAAADHGVLENSNDLIGDIIFYDYANSQSDGMPMVHIEAFGENNLLAGHAWGMDAFDFQGLGINTFWNKYEMFWAGIPPYDCRENLPLRWAFRYIGNEAFDGGTWVDVWRSHYPGWDHWYIPGGGCDWGGTIGLAYTLLYDYVHGLYHLHPPALICYDEQEESVSGGGPSPPPTSTFDELYLESQRVIVESPTWPLPAESGWCAIAFDTDALYDTGPGYGWSFDQSWLNVRYSALNKYTVGLSGGSYLNGCALVWDGATAFVPTPTH